MYNVSGAVSATLVLTVSMHPTNRTVRIVPRPPHSLLLPTTNSRMSLLQPFHQLPTIQVSFEISSGCTYHQLRKGYPSGADLFGNTLFFLSHLFSFSCSFSFTFQLALFKFFSTICPSTLVFITFSSQKGLVHGHEYTRFRTMIHLNFVIRIVLGELKKRRRNNGECYWY